MWRRACVHRGKDTVICRCSVQHILCENLELRPHSSVCLSPASGLQAVLPQYLRGRFVQAALSYIGCNEEGQFVCRDNDCWCQCAAEYPQCNCPEGDLRAMEASLLQIRDSWNVANQDFEESGQCVSLFVPIWRLWRQITPHCCGGADGRREQWQRGPWKQGTIASNHCNGNSSGHGGATFKEASCRNTQKQQKSISPLLTEITLICLLAFPKSRTVTYFLTQKQNMKPSHKPKAPFAIFLLRYHYINCETAKNVCKCTWWTVETLQTFAGQFAKLKVWQIGGTLNTSGIDAKKKKKVLWIQYGREAALLIDWQLFSPSVA